MKGRCVGTDRWGNRYYRQKSKAITWHTEQRWVLYKGLAEASKVPPLWSAWFRHEREVPTSGDEQGHFWERPHLPNLTGTPFAFNPLKSPYTTSFLEKKPPYQPWSPSAQPRINRGTAAQ
jgi:NADH:ubiquinone oxidoreductase subunit